MPLPRLSSRDVAAVPSVKRTRLQPQPQPRPPPSTPILIQSGSSTRLPQLQQQQQTFADALRCESSRVVAAVQAPLRSLVSVHVTTASDNSSSSRTINAAAAASESDLDTGATTDNLVLTLTFARSSKRPTHRRDRISRFLCRNALMTKRVAPALDALALVLAHAQLLACDAMLRADFWGALLDSCVLVSPVSTAVRAWVERIATSSSSNRCAYRHECQHGRDCHVTSPYTCSWTCSSPLLPCVVLAFGGDARVRLDRRWFDALYQFLTEPQHASPLSRQLPDQACSDYNSCCQSHGHGRRRVKIFVGLSFADAALSAVALTRIQRLLDCVAPGCSCDIGIDVLDLSRNAMAADALTVVTSIVRRNVLYQIADIRLDAIATDPRARTDATAVHDLLAAALSASVRCVRVGTGFGAGDDGACSALQSLSHSVGSSCSARSPAVSLVFQPRISFAANALNVEHIVGLCAALRYGSGALAALSLSSMLQHIEAPHDRTLCWRWLAFGLFYHRSRRFSGCSTLRRVELAARDVALSDLDAFASALYNPVAALRWSSGTPEHCNVAAAVVDAVLVAIVQRGAIVRALPDANARSLVTLAHAQSLELLHSSADTAWVCVVVAGVGLGWLDATHVVSVTSDLIGVSASSRSRSHNESAVTTMDPTPLEVPMHTHASSTGDSNAARLELVVHSEPRELLSIAAQTFIETVGRQLWSLAVHGGVGLSIVRIAYHCAHVTHLDLAGCDLATAGTFSDLLGCLRGPFGRRLVSLNLNHTGATDADVAALGKLLRDPRRLLRLRTLRLVQMHVTHVGLASLRLALRRNRTLALVELAEPDADARDEWTSAARVRLDAECHNVLVRGTSLRLAHKLALLSAVLGVQQNKVEPSSAVDCDDSRRCRDLRRRDCHADQSCHGSPSRRRRCHCGPVVNSKCVDVDRSDDPNDRDDRVTADARRLEQGLRLCSSVRRDLTRHAPRVFDAIFAFAEDSVRRQIVWTKCAL